MASLIPHSPGRHWACPTRCGASRHQGPRLHHRHRTRGAAEAGDVTSRQVEAIWSSVRGLVPQRCAPAPAVCVRRHGAVILNRAIGHASGNGPSDGRDTHGSPPRCRRRSASTRSPRPSPRSWSKLIERGLLTLEDPVADYIPGYEKNRKHRITIGQVLAHRAGVPNLPSSALDLDRLADRQFLVEILADAEPFAKPGKYLAYHAVSGGFILGEIVHAVTGQDIRTVLAEEFLAPGFPLDQLRGGGRGRRQRRAQLPDRPLPHRFPRCSAARWESVWTSWSI